jgi:hypothetical protein
MGRVKVNQPTVQFSPNELMWFLLESVEAHDELRPTVKGMPTVALTSAHPK